MAPSASDHSIRVVVGDDCQLKRVGVVAALEEDPRIEVVGECGTDREALELAKALQPDVVIIEPNRPDRETVAVLRRFPEELPTIRVLTVTVSELVEDLVDAVAAGVSGYLDRTTTCDELRDAVKQVHAGSSVIAPRLASELMRHYAELARQEALKRPASLTRREEEVLRLLTRGHTQAEIGDELHVSGRTVQVDLARIRQKTGIKRRSDLLRWASEQGIL
jgi:DNA-binding NarL/FixJ family response regulator